MSAAETMPASRWKTPALWALKIVLALLFLGAGGFKLSGAPAAVAEFGQIGLGQWFRYFTALCEIGGALLLLAPAFAGFGALLLTCVSIGAFFAQLLVLHQDVIHTIVLALILAAIAWTNRKSILDRLNSGA
jgi:putative oxidoreductase